MFAPHQLSHRALCEVLEMLLSSERSQRELGALMLRRALPVFEEWPRRWRRVPRNLRALLIELLKAASAEVDEGEEEEQLDL